MPYILVRGNLASYGHRYPWRVLVSGLKASDIEQLSRFASGGYCDDSTIVYLQHPCVILTALEVLGYKVVASSSTSVKQDYNEYMWTMRKDFSEPEPEPVLKTVCKFCNQLYIQNATLMERMKRHLEKCPKCREDIRQQFIQVAHSKQYKTSNIDKKINDGWLKQESSVDQNTNIQLEDLDDWNYKNQLHLTETSNAIQQNMVLVMKNNEQNWVNQDNGIENNDTDISSDSQKVTIRLAGPQARSSLVHQRKSYNPRRLPQWPVSSTHTSDCSPLQNKIYQEQLLERRALRKSAELEVQCKALELQKFQWEYERDKLQTEVRWAHETRMMQLKEEREKQLTDYSRIKTVSHVT
ncbi:hypothetical protein WH47_10382 [Habropoda laboriosa]|uniref:Uncharacterized protein n=1 Tax=Habropoda laboriosa TaxID=597456 RepID=A0A0L7R9R2_9HYME|nr:hypothetical protein WH47_10382 [Habropoda laboriosa]